MIHVLKRSESRGARWLFIAVLAAGLAVSTPALAGFLDIFEVEPTSFTLSFGRVPFDVPSASQRIRIRNITSGGASMDVRPEAPFVITASGGSLAPGQEAFWDVACQPTDPGLNNGFLDIDWCGANCDDASGFTSFTLECTAGLLDPPAPQISLPRVHAFETSQLAVPWTNATSDPVTVTGFATSDPAFTAALSTGGLPQTVLPGASLTSIVTFDTTGADATAQLDVLAGTAVVGRTHVAGSTIKQIDPISWSFGAVPQGAAYTLPIQVRNSSLVTRRITVASADLPEVTIDGLVGQELAPGAIATGLVTVTAQTLGSRTAHVTVAFNTGNGDVASYFANVVSPTFSVTTGDAVPGDGRLDFGTSRAGAPPLQRTFTISNRTGASVLVQCAPPGGANAPFTLVSTCPVSISAHASAAFTVRLTPSIAGTLQTGIGVELGASSLLIQLDARIVDP